MKKSPKMDEGFYNMPHFKDSIVVEMQLQSALKHRTIYLSEDVGEDSIFRLNYYLDRIERIDEKEGLTEFEPITIIISSFGGSVYQALSTISRVERLQEKGYIIKTVIDAISMSCGSLISQAGSKGHRYSNRYATILYHQISSGAWGTLADMEVGLEETNRLWDLLKQITLKHTDVTPEWFDSLKHRS